MEIDLFKELSDLLKEKEGDEKGTIEIYEMLVVHYPDYEYSWFKLGDIAMEKSAYRKAITYFEKAANTKNEIYIVHKSRMKLATCYELLGEEENSDHYETLSQTYRTKVNAHLSEMVESSMDFYGTEVEEDEHYRTLWFQGGDYDFFDGTLDLLIESYMQAEEYEKAERYSLILIEKYPNDAFYSSILGDIYLETKRYKEAISFYERVLWMESLETLLKSSYVHAIAYCYMELGKMKEAVSYARSAIKDDPDNIDYIDTLAESYAGMKQYDKALRCYRKVASIDASYGEVEEKVVKMEELCGCLSRGREIVQQ